MFLRSSFPFSKAMNKYIVMEIWLGALKGFFFGCVSLPTYLGVNPIELGGIYFCIWCTRSWSLIFLPWCLMCSNRGGWNTRKAFWKTYFSSTLWKASGLDLQLHLPLLGLAWELGLLFDLVCFGLLIKHVFCFVGGASQSGATWFTHTPSIRSSSTGVRQADPEPEKKERHVKRRGRGEYQPLGKGGGELFKFSKILSILILVSKREFFTTLHVHNILHTHLFFVCLE